VVHQTDGISASRTIQACRQRSRDLETRFAHSSQPLFKLPGIGETQVLSYAHNKLVSQLLTRPNSTMRLPRDHETTYDTRDILLSCLILIDRHPFLSSRKSSYDLDPRLRRFLNHQYQREDDRGYQSGFDREEQGEEEGPSHLKKVGPSSHSPKVENLVRSFGQDCRCQLITTVGDLIGDSLA
jgi:hypothetical protein